MTFTNPHRILLGAVMALSVSLAHAISSPNNPPDNDSPTKPAWKVTSAYGPRVAAGTKFHEGIDYSPKPGDADKGTIIKSRTAGTIVNISNQGAKHIVVKSPTGKFTYLHIFYDARGEWFTVANANVKAAGYTKVQLGINVRVKPKVGGIRPCNAILFWEKVNGIEKISRVLTTLQCPGVYTDLKTGQKVTVKTRVAAEEDIAPLGTSYPPNGITAHLHLQVNAGDNNVLAWLDDHDFGLIRGAAKRFTAKLHRNRFVAAMAHWGFAIMVTENAKVPDLDEVTVALDGGSTPIETFSFGGRKDQGRKNASNASIDTELNLDKGSSVPRIKPIKWGESGTRREMWFFVPYPKLLTLSPGKHTLNVIVKTVTGKSFPISLTFTVYKFDGAYTGSYSGTETCTIGGVTDTEPVSGDVVAGVHEHTISLSSPGSGTGTIRANGNSTFGGGSSDGTYTLSGLMTVNRNGVASGSGSWSSTHDCGTASGTWSVSRQNLVNVPPPTFCACVFDVLSTVFGPGGAWSCHNTIRKVNPGFLTSPGVCECRADLFQVCQ